MTANESFGAAASGIRRLVAFRRSRPLVPTHRDHPLRSIATSVVHLLTYRALVSVNRTTCPCTSPHFPFFHFRSTSQPSAVRNFSFTLFYPASPIVVVVVLLIRATPASFTALVLPRIGGRAPARQNAYAQRENTARFHSRNPRFVPRRCEPRPDTRSFDGAEVEPVRRAAASASARWFPRRPRANSLRRPLRQK
jgi:hypothetical protein